MAGQAKKQTKRKERHRARKPRPVRPLDEAKPDNHAARHEAKKAARKAHEELLAKQAEEKAEREAAEEEAKRLAALEAAEAVGDLPIVSITDQGEATA